MLLRLLFSIFIFVFSLMQAQVTISGKVTSKGKGLKNVSVTLKDTYDGATTDANGNYTFQTTEKGTHFVIFSIPDFTEVSKEISLSGQEVLVNAELKSSFSEISGVSLTSESISSIGKKASSTLLKPLDYVTTPGGEGQITATLAFLPGVQKVEGNTGLFVRGGTSSETKAFIDGNLVNNFYYNTLDGLSGRDRFNSAIFKKTDFSRGAYSALYGQAMSSVLVLESVDIPERSSGSLGILPIIASGSFQHVNTAKNASFGASLSYLNMNWFTKLMNYSTKFDKGPKGVSGDMNFRIRTKSGGFIKYFGNFDQNIVGTTNDISGSDFSSMKYHMNSGNTYHNLSYKEKFGAYLLNVGTSFSYNKSGMSQNIYGNNGSERSFEIQNHGSYVNAKAVLERKISTVSLRGGVELQNAIEDTSFKDKQSTIFKSHFNNATTSLFAESEWNISSRFSSQIGVRAENSTYLNKWNFAPRAAFGYRLSKDWTAILSYGIFYQIPDSQYLNYKLPINFQRADHYNFQIQKASALQNFRFEAFYKDYKQLTKTHNFFDPDNQSSYNNYPTAVNVNGNGFAKGIELFWRDAKTIKGIDYWVSYTYLDSQRDFNNYPRSLVPTFAARHTLSLVAKKYMASLKTQINVAYTYTSGRPYYDIISQNGEGVVRNQGHLTDYGSLNLSLNYLPKIGKKDSKTFAVFFISAQNILNKKNISGYNFSSLGERIALRPLSYTMINFGFFINFGIDKTQDVINNTL